MKDAKISLMVEDDASIVRFLRSSVDASKVKSFSALELMTRLQGALRHGQQALEELPIYDYEGLRVDLRLRRVWVGERQIHLSPLQYAFLAELVRQAGRVVAHQQLVDVLWAGHEPTKDCMRVFVYQIRRKIERDPSKPRLLKTEPGVGYRLESPNESVRSPSSLLLSSLTTF